VSGRRRGLSIVGTLLLLGLIIPSSPATLRFAAGVVPGEIVPWMVGTVPVDWLISDGTTETSMPMLNVVGKKPTVAVFVATGCTASAQLLQELTAKLDQIEPYGQIAVIWESERSAQIARESEELRDVVHYNLAKPKTTLQRYPMLWILNDKGEVVFDRRGAGAELWGAVLAVLGRRSTET
jgi:hypothetical protein